MLFEVTKEVIVGFLRAGGEQGWSKGNAIRFPLQFRSGKFSHGGQQVLKSADVVTHRSRLHFSGPAHDERFADAAIGQVALDAAQGAVGVEEVGLVPAFLMRTVVAAEHDDGVLINAQGAEFREDTANFVVEKANELG